MYQEFFKFVRKPFEQLPDPAFLFLTDEHDEALTRMQFALAINDSFAVITGEVGLGKTTLVRKLLSEMTTDKIVAFITHTRVSDIELLQLILVEFGIQPFHMGKVEMLVELRRFIETRHSEGKRVIIIVDEAQNLGIDVLEELRLLTCLDSTEEKAVNVILIGQPQLSRRLESPDLEQLRQRCRLHFHLHRLSKEQTRQYIEHRLTVALGTKSEIFDAESESAVFEHTRGIPRLINTLCDTALVMTRLADQNRVTKERVAEAVAELGWAPPQRSHDKNEELADATIASLTLTKDGQVVSKIGLQEASYVIGRADDCSIIVDSKYLSRHHAILNRDETGWTISDLKSTNGISVNGSSVQSLVLRDGDIIAIGAHYMEFRETESAESMLTLTKDDTSSSVMAETLVMIGDYTGRADD